MTDENRTILIRTAIEHARNQFKKNEINEFFHYQSVKMN
ncbi:hypothetical protein DDI_4442 [Dickeya dianthicola RNS04.9]|nr:hypothetical protein DDI_4442 [Dickeya dianthicola RNS04.9]